jgi:lysophospholipase L1-like esterase
MKQPIRAQETKRESQFRDQALLLDVKKILREGYPPPTKGNLCVWGDSWVSEWGIQIPLRNGGYGWNPNAAVDFCSKGLWIQDMAVACDGPDSFMTYLSQVSPNPRAILLSGGGNDSVKQTLLKLANPRGAAPAINQAALDLHLDGKIIPAYEKIVSSIKTIAAPKPIPIVIHGYDLAIPFTSSSSLINLYSNAWLRKPLLTGLNYTELEGKAIMRDLLTQLNQKLQTFATRHADRVVYVNLIGTLQEKWDTEAVACWHDNMHPNQKGRELMAIAISTAIDTWYQSHA